ncbi:MAG: FecR domain-containing protein [Spongiibacteraceae bacterium]|nr:FecR domain-containing protein [Spongiibacteraceae bacterium]
MPDELETVEDEAAYWYVRLTADDLTAAERRAFERWRQADSVHALTYQRIARGNAIAESVLDHPELQALAAAASAASAADSVHSRRRSMHWLQAIAATLVVTAGVLWVAEGGWLGSPTGDMAAPQVLSYDTGRGERSKVQLSDGTRVTLNTDSQIQVAYAADARAVTLVRGQAYFSVASDANRPFQVDAGGQRVVALGTAFDVRLEDEAALRVTLVEGRVAVHDRSAVPADVGEPLTLPGALVLEPGQQLIVGTDGKAQVSAVPLDEVTSWRDGRLVFRNRPLPEVVTEMNRYTARQLYLDDDPRLGSVVISGVFDAGKTSSLLAVLEKVYQLNVGPADSDNLLISWGE